MKLEIHWQGLYGSGLFLHMVEGMQNLLRTRIYLRIKSYSGGRTVTYVGPSNQFLEGINQHIAAGVPGANPWLERWVWPDGFHARVRCPYPCAQRYRKYRQIGARRGPAHALLLRLL